MSPAVVRSREKPHTTAPYPTATTAPPPPAPATEPADRPYRGDRWGLIFWLGCAGLLVALHVGQHIVYLLR
jgi:hypothetical protein